MSEWKWRCRAYRRCFGRKPAALGRSKARRSTRDSEHGLIVTDRQRASETARCMRLETRESCFRCRFFSCRYRFSDNVEQAAVGTRLANLTDQEV